MVTAFTVWYLMTIGTTGVVTYSPPMKDQATCQQLQAQVDQSQFARNIRSQCIVIKSVQ